MEAKGKHDKMGDERDIWERGGGGKERIVGGEEGGRGSQGRKEGRSQFSAEGWLSLR